MPTYWARWHFGKSIRTFSSGGLRDFKSFKRIVQWKIYTCRKWYQTMGVLTKYIKKNLYEGTKKTQRQLVPLLGFNPMLQTSVQKTGGATWYFQFFTVIVSPFLNPGNISLLTFLTSIWTCSEVAMKISRFPNADFNIFYNALCKDGKKYVGQRSKYL